MIIWHTEFAYIAYVEIEYIHVHTLCTLGHATEFDIVLIHYHTVSIHFIHYILSHTLAWSTYITMIFHTLLWHYPHYYTSRSSTVGFAVHSPDARTGNMHQIHYRCLIAIPGGFVDIALHSLHVFDKPLQKWHSITYITYIPIHFWWHEGDSGGVVLGHAWLVLVPVHYIAVSIHYIHCFALT